VLSNGQTSSVQVSINGNPAPLSYVSQGQINLQVPYELASSFNAATNSFPAILTLTGAGIVTSYSLTIQPVAPGIFVNGGVLNGAGGHANGPDNPAPPGTPITVLYTGAGALSSPILDGAAPPDSTAGPTPVPLSRITLTIHGNNISPMEFSNLLTTNPTVQVTMAPGQPGVAQATFTLPADLPNGPYMISIALSGVIGSASTPVVVGNSVPLTVGSCSANCSK
jgi:uncharacterized protein (TIGR03437 family)